MSEVQQGDTPKVAFAPGAAVAMHFGALDGLRGVAAIAVLLGHASVMILGVPLVPNKALSVQFFFALSGFVLAYAYGDQLRQGMSFADFMRRRVIRLYPMIVFGAFASMLAWMSTSRIYGADVGSSAVSSVLGLLALPGPKAPFSFSHFPLNPPQWSLFWEMVCYVGFALSVRVASRRVLVTGICIALILGTIGRFGSPSFDVGLHGQGCSAAVGFMVGLLMWEVRKDARTRIRHVPTWILYAGIVVFCLVPARWSTPAWVLVSTLGCGAVIWFGSSERAVTAADKLLGRLSYPLYMIHWPVLLVARAFIAPAIGPWGAVVVGCAASIVLAYGVCALYDEPVRAYLGRIRWKIADQRSTAGDLKRL